VICSCLGVDMFDCVFSTRTARFGTAFTKYGFIKLKHSDMMDDFRPIEEGCKCDVLFYFIIIRHVNITHDLLYIMS
jgi:tRNA-guanine family transglycosylase